MFLPNTDSFVLIRSSTVKPEFSVFSPPHQRFWCGGLPNTHSFILVRRTIVDPVRGKTSLEEGSSADHAFQAGRTSNGVNDQKKRNFLKVASIAGAGIVASQLLSPKKASAFIMGSSPTTGVVGVKNAANTRINPATEETVSSLSNLTFDTGSLQVKVTSVPTASSSSFSDSGTPNVDRKGLVDADRHVQVDVLSSALPSSASTEDTLETISFGDVQFALRLATAGDFDYVGEAVVGTGGEGDGVWRIKRIDSSSGIVIKWADGNAGLTHTWTGYAGHTYS